jgi:hypothetical protein
MPNRTEARPAKAVLTYATGRLSPLRLFSTPLADRVSEFSVGESPDLQQLASGVLPTGVRDGSTEAADP